MMTAPTSGLMGVASIDAVLRLARTVPVFPCRAADEQVIVDGRPKLLKAKSPRIENGFLKASQDENQIRAWWKRWPDALVGVPMGLTTGIVVVDYDHGKHTDDTSDWIERHTEALMAARVHGTRSGGLHYLYRIAQGQRYRSGTNCVLDGKARPGIDVRAEGGYVIWWPLHGGSITNDQAPFLPAGLIDERAFTYQNAAPAPRKEPSPQEWQSSRMRILDALAYLPPDERDLWIKVGAAIHLATGGNDEGFEAWHAWSSGGLSGEMPHNYGGIEDCRYTWSTFRHDGNALSSLGTIIHEAKQRGFKLPERGAPSDHAAPIDNYTDADIPAAQSAQSETQASEPSEEPVDPIRRPMQWSKLEQEKPPERLWRIAHWLSTGPTLLAGSGGVGKTLVAQTIATALAIGRGYVDAVEEPCRILFWACEDDHDELWRRQIAICEFFGITLPELEGKLIIEPRLGCDNTVYSLAFGRPAWTPLRDELRDQIGDYKADVLFLDNIAQTYGANENDRHHVTSFLNGVIGMVRDRPFSPVIMGHPSRGLASEFSGSSAWENAVRMRWYMGSQLPDQKPEADAPEEDPNVRYLSKRKTNYSVKDYRKLYWKDGVFVPEKTASGPSFSDRYNYPIRKEGAIAAVLSSLKRFNDQGIRVTDAKNSPDYLPTKMREAKLAQDYSPKELAEAMAGLRLQGRITVTKVGSYGNRNSMAGLVTADFRAQDCTK